MRDATRKGRQRVPLSRLGLLVALAFFFFFFVALLLHPVSFLFRFIVIRVRGEGHV
jgi:Flp pilus assembly protein TadB